MHSIRLLMLSGASLVGQNILNTLVDRRGSFHLTALNSVATEPALMDFDQVYLSGNLKEDPDRFAGRFRQVLEETDPHLVIPCRDDDVAFLARYAAAHPELARRLLAGAPEPAEAMLDKLDSWRFSHRDGLPFTPTLSANEAPEAVQAFARQHGYPLLAKPREGFASHGVVLLLDADQLQQISGRTDYILQKYLGEAGPVREYVQGIASVGVPLFHSFEAVKLSLQAFIAPDGQVVGLFATRNTMRQGRSEKVVVDPDPELAELGRRCGAVFSARGWRGPLNIQCQRSPTGELMIYEYNGRFTGATGARYLLGYDEVGLALKWFYGRELEGRPRDSELPRDVARLPVSRAADPAMVRSLQASGYWRR